MEHDFYCIYPRKPCSSFRGGFRSFDGIRLVAEFILHTSVLFSKYSTPDSFEPTNWSDTGERVPLATLFVTGSVQFHVMLFGIFRTRLRIISRNSYLWQWKTRCASVYCDWRTNLHFRPSPLFRHNVTNNIPLIWETFYFSVLWLFVTLWRNVREARPPPKSSQITTRLVTSRDQTILSRFFVSAAFNSFCHK